MDERAVPSRGGTVNRVGKRELLAVVAFVAALISIWIGGITLAPAAKASASVPTPRSCFFYRGKRKWCIVREGRNWWWPCGVAEVGRENGVYWVSEGNTELGYMRPSTTTPGLWRGVPQEAAYGGWVRRGTRGRYFISRRGVRLGIARGPDALAVGAHKLFAFDPEC
jgi:hypothetical protein